MQNIENFWEKYYIHTIIGTVVLFFIYIFWFYSSFFYSWVLNYKWINSDEFDWAIYPIEFVIDPIKLNNYEERKKPFEEIDSKYFIKTPIYNPEIFWKNLDDIDQKDPDYKIVMTQKVTYTVPYLGNYKLQDYKEYAWSHPWIDIISPQWTPVLNIANWFVVDVWNQPAWFWNYIVIKHSDINYAWKKQNIYSLYGHLSKTLVQAWSKIKKWTLIWLVWESWTATTSHLHFQIDVEDAPYIPYWPFSTQDMKNAWVWFFEAINIGLWKENAIKYTLNSLKFVNDNLNYTLYTQSTPTIKEDKKEEIAKEEVIKEDEEIKQEPNNQEVIKDENITIETPQVKHDDIIIKENDNSLANLVKKEDLIQYDLELLSAWSIDDIILKDNNIKNLELKYLKQEDNIIIDEIKNINTQNKDTQVVDKIQDNIINEEDISNLDNKVEDNIINNKLFLDINNDYKYLNELKYFKEKEIISWFVDNTFRPKNNITRAESLKIILLANQINPINDQESKFSDISTNTWENSYINAWIEKNILSLENKNFYPFRDVSRIEWLKLILTLWGIDLESIESSLVLDDTSKDDWYYKYVVYAVDNKLFDIENNKFYPNKPLSREELMSILYKYINK